MKRTLFFLAFLFAAAPVVILAQSATTPTPAITNHPFTAQVWATVSLAGSNQPPVATRTDVARDSAGSIRREARVFANSASSQPTGSINVEIFDARNHLFIRLDPATQIASITAHGATNPSLIPTTGRPFNAVSTVPPVYLGTQTLGAYSVMGSHRIWSYTDPSQGTTPIVITQDTWTSPELRTALLIQTSDSLGHSTTTTLKEIVIGEPDPSLFAIPPGYTKVNLDVPVANPPAPQQSAATSPAIPIPMPVLYREFFLYAAHLVHASAAYPNVPAGGSFVDLMQKNTGLSDAEWQQVTAASLRVEQEIGASNAQMTQLRAQYTQVCPAGPQSCSGPPPDMASLSTLRSQQDQAVASEAAALESLLGADTTKLHAYLQNEIGAHTARIAPAVPNSQSIFTTEVSK